MSDQLSPARGVVLLVCLVGACMWALVALAAVVAWWLL